MAATQLVRFQVQLFVGGGRTIPREVRPHRPLSHFRDVVRASGFAACPTIACACSSSGHGALAWSAKLAFARAMPHAVVGQEGEALLGERRAERVAQDAHARHLQDVADLVGLQPGQGAKVGLPVGARDVDAVSGDRVKPMLHDTTRRTDLCPSQRASERHRRKRIRGPHSTLDHAKSHRHDRRGFRFVSGGACFDGGTDSNWSDGIALKYSNGYLRGSLTLMRLSADTSCSRLEMVSSTSTRRISTTRR